MKFFWACLFLTLSIITAKAQITLGPEIFPAKNDTLPFNRTIISPEEIPLRLFDTTKASFEIDLSHWDFDEKGVQVMEDPKNMTAGGQVPKAELAYSTSFGDFYFNFSEDDMNVIGIGPALDLPTALAFQFDSAVAHVETPLEYGNTYNKTTTTSRDLGFLKVEATMNSQYQVNGYGTIISPDNKLVEVLRVRRRYEFEIKTTPMAGPTTTETALFVNWEFYSDSVKNTFLRAETRYQENDTIVLFDFAEQKQFTKVKRNVQPNLTPVLSHGTIHFQKMVPHDLKIYRLNGQEVSFEQVNYNRISLLNLKRNQFIVCNWTDENGSRLSYKLFCAQL